MLNFQTWIEEEKYKSKKWGEMNEMYHICYEKPGTSKLVIEERSVMPHMSKIINLFQELIRRMRNTYWNLPLEVRVRICNEFPIKMWRSGY